MITLFIKISIPTEIEFWLLKQFNVKTLDDYVQAHPPRNTKNGLPHHTSLPIHVALEIVNFDTIDTLNMMFR